MQVWVPHEHGLEHMGAIPDGVELDFWAGGELPATAAAVEFFVPPFLATSALAPALGAMPKLKVVQLMSAGADAFVGSIPAGVTLCDAMGVHTAPTAEWACAAILASVRELPRFVRALDEQRWDFGKTGELCGATVLIVGSGDIGRAVEARLTPFDVSFLRVARTAREGVHDVSALPQLLPQADVVVVITPLTPATRGLVDASFLAAMKDGALLVNAARGPVVVTDALVEALGTGRITAALDVTDPEPLPSDHPLWRAPGLLLTPHVAGTVPGTWRRAYGLVGEQLRRYCADPATLRNVVTEAGY